MGIPFTGSSIGTPPAGDQANAVLQGTITAIGPTASFPFYGGFNVSLWGSRASTLTTTAGSLSSTVGSATGLAVGQSVSNANVPAGTTIAVISGTTLTLAVPPGKTSADIVTAIAAATVFATAVTVATVALERSFDGGVTWINASSDAAGTATVFTNPTGVSIYREEWERMVSYRMNATAYTSGAGVNYRISQTGSLATVTGRP